jgi:hypothetical protein
MASSTESLLRLELQATNENDGTWGTKNNTNLELLAFAVAGHSSVDISGGAGDTTLTTANYSSDQARSAFITLTGTLTGNRNVIIPSSTKSYIFRRNTTGNFTVTVKTAAGAGVLIPSGAVVQVFCNGTVTFASSDATERLPLTGGALTGGLALSASTTTSALGVATQGYVDTTKAFYLPLTGGTLSGAVTVSTAVPNITLKKSAAGQGASITARTGDNLRWSMVLGNGTTESGSNTGSDFVLASYDDSGAFLANAMTVERRTTIVTFTGNVITNGSMSALSYITTSDEKLKTNLVPLEGILQDVERLEPTYFSWTKEAQAKGKGAAREVGLLAQQLAVNFPELVHEDPGATALMGTPTLGIDYSKLAVLALAAIQELSAKVRKLERQLTAA